MRRGAQKRHSCSKDVSGSQTAHVWFYGRSTYIIYSTYLAASRALFRSCMLPTLLSRGLRSPTRAMGLSRTPVHSLSYREAQRRDKEGRGAGTWGHRVLSR